MKRLLFLSLIAMGAFGSSWAVAPGEDAYAEACRMLGQARQAWEEKDNDLAWRRYLEAQRLFVAIQRAYPGWNSGAVAAHLGVCISGGAKTAPGVIRELDQSIRELKQLSAGLDKLKTQKLIALQQADWEYNFVYDRVSRLMDDYVDRQTIGEAEEEVIAVPPPEDEEFSAALEEAGLAEPEIVVGFDTDEDGLLDEMEVEIGTDPNDPDTDNDGFYDGDEVDLGYDPLDDSSHPEVAEVDDYDRDNVNWEEQEGYTEDGDMYEER